MIGAVENKTALYGVGTIETDGVAVSNVPLCIDFETGRVGYQFVSTGGQRIADICFDRVASVSGRFASPWGYFVLAPSAQWTSYSAGGGGWRVGGSPLSGLAGGAFDWSWRWLSTNQEVEIQAPYSFDEILLVGRSRDVYGRMILTCGCEVISRKNSLSILGKVKEEKVYPFFVSVASIAAGAALQVHSVQRGDRIYLYGRSYASEEQTSQALAYSGYPMVNGDLERQELEKVLRAAEWRLSRDSGDIGPGSLEIMQYLFVRSSSLVSESKLISAFSFLESFCEKHLKKRDYMDVFSLNSSEADALNRYRNDLIHNNVDPIEATDRFEAKLKVSDSKLYQAMRDDIKGAYGAVALNYVMSICDQNVLRWIGYEGLCQTFFPMMEGRLLEWQGQPLSGRKSV